MGFSQAPVSWGTQPPSIPLGPARDEGNSRETAGCSREGGKDGCLTSLKHPPTSGPAPHPPSRQANHGRWLRRGGRAGVQGGHEGHAQIPECACVRGAGTTRRPSLPGRGQERSGRRAGQGFPAVRSASRARLEGAERGGSVAPSGPRPEPGRFLRRGRGDPALLDDEAAGQVL